MKFGQVIEHYKRNIFLQKLCWKWGKETSSRPLFFFFLKKKQTLFNAKVICSLVSIYISCSQLGIKQKHTVELFRLLIQRYAQFWFFKNESENSLSNTFCVWFFKKNISHNILLTDQISLPDCLYFLKYWWIYVYYNCLLTRFWGHKFWN